MLIFTESNALWRCLVVYVLCFQLYDCMHLLFLSITILFLLVCELHTFIVKGRDKTSLVGELCNKKECSVLATALKSSVLCPY